MWNRKLYITRLVTEPTSTEIRTHRYPSEGLPEGLKLRANHGSSWSSRSLSVPPTQACVVCSSPSRPWLSGVFFCNSLGADIFQSLESESCQFRGMKTDICSSIIKWLPAMWRLSVHTHISETVLVRVSSLVTMTKAPEKTNLKERKDLTGLWLQKVQSTVHGFHCSEAAHRGILPQYLTSPKSGSSDKRPWDHIHASKVSSQLPMSSS